MTTRVETTTPTDSPETTDLKWNFGVNLVERMFITLGMSMISATTILPRATPTGISGADILMSGTA